MESLLKQEKSDCINVVLFGPESTGKTTLAMQLAKHYNTQWVPEYMREYLQEKWNNEQKICEPKDLLPIAIGQIKLENELAKKTTNVLICDTNLLEIKTYSEIYYNGECDLNIEKYALQNIYDLYFLTYIDVPWEEDDLRDKPNEREHLYNVFKQALLTNKKPFVELKGNKEERFQIATKHIDKLLSKK